MIKVLAWIFIIGGTLILFGRAERKPGPTTRRTPKPEPIEPEEAFVEPEPVSVVLLDQGTHKHKTFARNQLDDVLYEGVLVTVEGEQDDYWVVLHFFPDGTVKLLLDKSKDNITKTAHIDKLVPVVSV